MKTQISGNSLSEVNSQLDYGLFEVNSRSEELEAKEENWDRAHFTMSAEELEVHEAIVAMSRVLDCGHVGPIARRALRYAVNALQVGGGKES